MCDLIGFRRRFQYGTVVQTMSKCVIIWVHPCVRGQHKPHKQHKHNTVHIVQTVQSGDWQLTLLASQVTRMLSLVVLLWYQDLATLMK